MFKALIKQHELPSLKTPDGTFSKINQPSLFKTLFNATFNAHDALEDVLALTKILFTSRLELSPKIIIDNSSVVSTDNEVATLNYLDRRHIIEQSFHGKLYHPHRKDGPVTKNMVEKIAGSGLAYDDLTRLFSRYGKEGLVAIFSKPPSSSSSSSARVTRNGRILAAVVQHFHKHN